MRRYPAFDPPEYVSWSPDPDVIRGFGEQLSRHPERAAVVEAMDDRRHLELYRSLLRTRLHDIQLKRWVRGGVISKAWLGTGEEAVTVGNVAALDPSRDVLCPMIRNAGSLHMMGMPLADMFRGYLASRDSPNSGRDVHLGDLSRGILQPVSQMGSNVPLIAGMALSFRQRGEDRVALTWIGDGASRTAACHEGINFAAVQRLPAVYVLQNNQVALGTAVGHHGAGSFDAYPAMYGLPGWKCDGNNVLDVYAATRLAVDLCRRGEGPAVVVAETFRMGGHATHDEREARDMLEAELFEGWGRRDPIGMYEAWLIERGFDRSRLESIETEVVEEMDAASDEAVASRDRLPEPQHALYEGFSEGGVLVGLERRPVRVSIEPRVP
jgi:pyruvate dehydrogenase E1 component alpha subunit/2-oxoisovalerate dehydrogenase E1 component alpha subunit